MLPEPLRAAAGAGQQFAVSVAGVGLLLPGDLAIEYVADADVYPLPGAPRRLRGVMQVRGDPFPVFDAGRHDRWSWPVRARQRVIVVPVPAAGGAVIVDEAPRSVDAGDPVADMPPPGTAFDAALGQARSAAGDPQVTCWWNVDFARFFELLAADRAEGEETVTRA